jgi:predicted nucleotidyltransferase
MPVALATACREARALRQSLIEEGYEVALRTGDVDDPIPGLLEIRDRYGNRVDLLLGLRGMDPELLNRARQVRLGEAILAIVGKEDFIAMKAFAGGPVDLADARAVIDLDRELLDLELLRRLAQRFGRDTAQVVADLIGVQG